MGLFHREEPPIIGPNYEPDPQHFTAVPPIWGDPEEWETEEEGAEETEDGPPIFVQPESKPVKK